MAGRPDRYPRNCEGPFYVASDECLLCGAPESEADGLISHDEDGHCFFIRQPVTAQETNAAIRSVWAACCGAVRYGGSDPQILARLAHLGATFQCDQQPRVNYTQVVRNCAHFEYRTAKRGFAHCELSEIVKFIADAMLVCHGTECFEFRSSWNEASFEYRWSSEVVASSYSVQFSITDESADRWSLRISDHKATPRPTYPSEVAHPLTAIAIRVDKALQRNAAFRSIRWFGEGLGPEDRKHSPHPY